MKYKFSVPRAFPLAVILRGRRDNVRSPLTSVNKDQFLLTRAVSPEYSRNYVFDDTELVTVELRNG